jgi:hypothetical protein
MKMLNPSDFSLAPGLHSANGQLSIPPISLLPANVKVALLVQDNSISDCVSLYMLAFHRVATYESRRRHFPLRFLQNFLMMWILQSRCNTLAAEKQVASQTGLARALIWTNLDDRCSHRRNFQRPPYLASTPG